MICKQTLQIRNSNDESESDDQRCETGRLTAKCAKSAKKKAKGGEAAEENFVDFFVDRSLVYVRVMESLTGKEFSYGFGRNG
jgi:hypothetical protein